MKITQALLIAATAFAPLSVQAQTSPSSAPPIPQTQAQSAPCTTGQSQAATTQNNKSGSTFADKWKKKINDEGTRIGTRTGVPMPTTDDLSSAGSAKPAPCLPKAAASAPAAAAQPATVKLPPDTLVTLRCNPMTPSPQGGARQTTLTLPDPKDFALPKATDFLADNVVPDTAAKTPCYLIKVDPKTGKSFVQ
jgi:hypothetical protein